MKTKPLKNYIGILDGAGGVWGVRLPNIDGCVGGGETPEAAIADVTQALRDVLAHKQVALPFLQHLPFPKSCAAKNQTKAKAR